MTSIKLSRKFLVFTQIPGLLFMLGFLQASSFADLDGRVFTLFDDAMISMGYAKTLAGTGELVWFPGADRVQGYTNLLWTLWMAFLHFLGFSGSMAALAVSITALVLIMITSVITGKITFSLLTVDHPQNAKFCGGLVAIFIPFLYPLTYWSLRGMETSLLSVLIVSIIYLSLIATRQSEDGLGVRRTILKLSFLASLGVLTRIDFLIPALIVFSVLLVVNKEKETRRFLILSCFFLIILTVAIFAFQYVYYGDFLTNTYRLKLDGFDIQTRIKRGIISSGKFLPLVALMFLSHMFLKSSTQKQMKMFSRLTVSTVSSITIYSIWVGGDAWEFMGINRYLSVTLPLLLAIAVIGVNYSRGFSKLGWGPRLIIGIAIVASSSLLISLTTNPFTIRVNLLLGIIAMGLIMYTAIIATLLGAKNKKLWSSILVSLSVVAVTNVVPFVIAVKNGFYPYYAKADFEVTNLSESLRKSTHPGAMIAVSWAGTPAYYASRSMVDLLGKSDRHIATSAPQQNLPANSWNREFYPGHNKFDFNYSIVHLKPDVVVDIRNNFDLEKHGYISKCILNNYRVYIRVDSEFINRLSLRTCQ
jgi:arabinofuranosyltransferase